MQGREGPVEGVVGRKPIHLLKEEQRKKVVELRELHIDIGAEDGDEAAELIRVGDPASCRRRPGAARRQPPGLPLDGQPPRRLRRPRGAAPLPRALHAPTASMAAVAAVQEEIGLFGARTSAFALAPRRRGRRRRHPRHRRPRDRREGDREPPARLGPGDRPRLHALARVFELLVAAAEQAGIEHTIEASGRGTHTDADAIQISRTGIPTGTVSIPLRYMHSPVELVDLDDLEATVELIVAFAASLDADVDLSR